MQDVNTKRTVPKISFRSQMWRGKCTVEFQKLNDKLKNNNVKIRKFFRLHFEFFHIYKVQKCCQHKRKRKTGPNNLRKQRSSKGRFFVGKLKTAKKNHIFLSKTVVFRYLEIAWRRLNSVNVRHMKKDPRVLQLPWTKNLRNFF